MFFEQLINNKILLISFFAWFVAQLIKLVIEIIKVRKIDISLLYSSGGMPSSHSSFVTSLATSVGFTNGFDSVEFAICFVLSSVVMYDATGVRQEAGKQAEVLNKFLQNIENHGINIDKNLKELIGHTPIQVIAGATLGIASSCFFYL